MKKKLIQIKTQEELDNLIEKQKEGYPLECFVQLNFGIRSSKFISLDEDNNYYVYNECDDSEEKIPHSNLMSTFIGEAISKGTLYKY